MSFKSARIKAGKTQEEAAEATGVSKSAVCGWEAGNFSPTAKRIKALASFYGCTVDELLTAEESEKIA